MIYSAVEFVGLRKKNDRRSVVDEAPEEVWLEVIEKFPSMREWVAHNETVRGPVLELLSRDPDEFVRREVASRPMAGEKILMNLAQDSSEGVRLDVLNNPTVTQNVLKILQNDPVQHIKKAAQQKLKNHN